MTKRTDDPLRLFEDPDAPAPLAEAVRAARGAAPDPAGMKTLALALGLPVPPLPIAPPLAPPPVAPAAGLAAGAGAAKLAVTGLAAATVVGAAAMVAVVGFGVGRHRPPALSAPAAVVEKLERRVPEPLENADDIAIAETAPSSAAPAPSLRRHHTTRPAPVAVAVEAPPAPVVEAPSDAASRLREEAALVQTAERLLATDPAGALRLTEERRRRFARGALDQEAEVVAIDALLRLGRRPEAATRAHAFEAAHAGSLHARRIRRLLGAD